MMRIEKIAGETDLITVPLSLFPCVRVYVCVFLLIWVYVNVWVCGFQRHRESLWHVYISYVICFQLVSVEFHKKSNNRTTFEQYDNNTYTHTYIYSQRWPWLRVCLWYMCMYMRTYTLVRLLICLLMLCETYSKNFGVNKNKLDTVTLCYC